MFTLKKLNVVWWPITISEPCDGGLIIEHKCQIHYELIGQSEYEEVAQKGDVALLERVVKGWREILGANNKELLFSKKNKEAFFNVSFVRAALIQGYWLADSGAPAKN